MKGVKGVEDLNIRIVRAQGIVDVGVSTRMFIVWSVVAGSPRTAPPGIRRAASSWFPLQLRQIGAG